MALPSEYRPTEAQWASVLKEVVAGGAVYHWPLRSGLYADRPFDELLKSNIAEALAAGPRSEPELKKTVPAGAQERLPRLLGTWASEGIIFAHPKRGRSRVWGAKPPDHLDYVLRGELHSIVAAFTAQGFSADLVWSTIRRVAGGTAKVTPASADPDLLLDRIRELNPSSGGGALVFLPHLRTASRDIFGDKHSFDRAVLALVEQRRVELQSTPVPSQLRPEERESMIDDGRGSFYMAIGLRSS